MCNELMNFKYQVESETETSKMTKDKINGWFSNYPKFLDAIFEVSYFTGKAEKLESPEGYFYAFGHNIVLRLPYTIQAISILLERGFYFETVSLVRNLYESFSQLRYFHKHQDKINNHILKNRVKFKVMFEELAPGYYAEIYGRQLSEFAHSGFASFLFRVQYDSADTGEITMGNKYDEKLCTYLLNQVVPIIYGILNNFPILFPQYSLLVPENTEIKRKESVAWLEKAMKDHRICHPQSKKFYDLINPLINH